MNSEELEQSLRAEFESYLKDVFGDIRREVDGFREKLDVEFRQHRERVDEALRELESKAFSERTLQESFRETVIEHLRLAKDEGARITATAIAEAEELHGSGPGEDRGAAFGDLRDAVADIASKSSQADILTSLVEHAAEYTPRGAFFIVKNEHLVGWKVFGLEDHEEPDAVRELYFPISERTALSEAVESLATVEAVGEGFSDAEVYLRRLGFEHAKKMYAIPLVARGRGVAVLYADCGENGGIVNSEALEMIVRVAGLTVELLASAPHAPAPVRESAFEARPAHEEQHAADSAEPEQEQEMYAESWSEPAVDQSETEPADPQPSFVESVEAEVYGEGRQFESEVTESYSFGTVESEPEPDLPQFEAPEPVDEDRGFSFRPAEPEPEPEPEPEAYAAPEIAAETEVGYVETVPVESVSENAEEEFAETFEPEDTEVTAEERFDAEVEKLYEYEEPESAQAEVEESEIPTFGEAERQDRSYAEPHGAEAEETAEESAASFEYSSLNEEAARAAAEFDAAHQSEPEAPESVPEAAAPAVEAVAAAESGSPVRRRFGDRNIDLPIEVPEEERQHHNAARRFARLLVSEIRLYNEQKVNEGCEANDLYDRLKEAIDRSREMYEKRVHGPVAERFDYFNYELVNNLAQGDESKLGDSYPGSRV